MDGGEIAAIARQWCGTPYRHQASTWGAGCDCLGLVRGVWRTLYGGEPQIVPPYSMDMRDAAGAGDLLAAARAHLRQAERRPRTGDVVLFRLHRNMPPRHCGIMADADRFIHAQEHIGVVEANLTAAWRRRIAGVFTFPERME